MPELGEFVVDPWWNCRKIVRVTSPSRSSPRNVRVSMRCEMPPILRLSSLKRLGPSASIITISTVHLSPTRDKIELTTWHSPGRCSVEALVTSVYLGFKNVPPWRAFDGCSYSPGHKLIPLGAQPCILLHIDSSILGGNSVSRKLSADIVARIKAATPDVVETYRDLANTPVPHLSGACLMATQSLEGNHAPAVQADLAIGGAVLQEFLAADTVVIGVAFYNFTIPSCRSSRRGLIAS